MSRQPIRVLTFIESSTVTGPSRILIDFASQSSIAEPDLPPVEVTLATFQRGDRESALANAAKVVHVPVITISERKRWDMAVLPELRRVIASCNPDILETRNVKSHFLVRLAGLQKRYPWVAWNHGYTSKDRLDRTYNQLDRWSLRGAFRVMTVCRPFAADLRKHGVDGRKITILHNFVKPYARPADEDVARVRRELGIGDESVIIVVGRMSREKGHADLLQAIGMLVRQPGLPKFRVVLVGDGPESARLAELRSSLGIEDRVVMTGFQRDVAPYYALATIFALPSHSEGSPNVVLEAMSAGLPIAATSVGGVPEILDNGTTGLLVTARDPKEMAEAITRLLTSKELRQKLGSAARRKVESDYTFSAYKRALTQFYVQTLQMRSARQHDH